MGTTKSVQDVWKAEAGPDFFKQLLPCVMLLLIFSHILTSIK